MFDDEPQGPAKSAIVLGEDLANLSVTDLEERLAALDAEAERVNAALSAKRDGLAAANAFFSTS